MAKKKLSTEPSEITVQEAFKEFIDIKTANGLAQATLDNYAVTFKNFWDYYNFDYNTICQEIEEKHFYRWQNHLLQQELSVESVNHYTRDLRTFMNFCFNRNYIDEFEIKLVRNQEQTINYFKPDEMDTLLEKPKDTKDYGVYRCWAIICFIYGTGARAQSVCDMKVEDVDFVKKKILFRHQKNKSLLVLPLSQQLENVLKEYMRKCRIGAEDYLFPNISNEKLTVNGLRKSLERYCTMRGVEPKGPHAIRHAFASQWIRNNGSAVKLQKILNHSTFSQTQRYIHLFGEDIATDYDSFSPLDIATKSRNRTKKVGKTDL